MRFDPQTENSPTLQEARAPVFSRAVEGLGQVGDVHSKSIARDLVTEVDVACERLLVQRIRAAVDQPSGDLQGLVEAPGRPRGEPGDVDDDRGLGGGALAAGGRGRHGVTLRGCVWARQLSFRTGAVD